MTAPPRSLHLIARRRAPRLTAPPRTPARLATRCHAAVRRLHDGEDGTAIVEFVFLAVVFLVPLVYLMIAMFSLQSAAYAAEGAARDAGRVYAASVSEPHARASAELTAHMAFQDFGLSLTGPPGVAVACGTTPCLTPGAVIDITVTASVRLPLLPDFLGSLGTVPVEGTAAVVVDRYRDR